MLPVHLESTVVVGEHCVFGTEAEARIRSPRTGASAGAIGHRTLIGNFVSIYEGVQVGEDCVIEDYVRIGYDAVVGARTRIMYGAYVCDRVEIGEDARVAGFVCDTASIGPGSTMMGSLVHSYKNPDLDWWGPDEASPVLLEGACVGMGATVIGAVTVGRDSYVAAGAIVTKDVPDRTLVTGMNQHAPR